MVPLTPQQILDLQQYQEQRAARLLQSCCQDNDTMATNVAPENMQGTERTIRALLEYDLALMGITIGTEVVYSNKADLHKSSQCLDWICAKAV